MKTASQQANKQYNPPRTAFGRTRSVDKSTKEDLVLSETLSPSIHTVDILVYRELTLLERKLDKSEISFRNSFFRDKSLREQEIRCYFEYLNGIAGIIKRKDSKLSKSIFRGLIGLDKTLEKLISGLLKELKNSTIIKPKTIDCFSQTVEEPKQEKFINESLPELENIKHLAEGLKKIKVSRIAGQLFDLYESLSKMQTEIPEPTLMPDRDIENTSPEMIMSMHLNVIKNHVFHLITESKSESSQKSVDKECQSETPTKLPEVKILEKTVFEKEKELFKVKERAEKSVIQHKVLEEKLKSMERYYKEIEKQQTESEVESARFKGRFQHSEIVIVAQEKRIQWFDGKLLKKTEKLVQAKLRIDELKKIIINKQKVMNKLQDELFDAKISWKVCEEKLFDIQKAWEHKTGRQFQHKEVDLEIIIAKHGIVKEDLSDKNEENIMNEQESSVSENEPPDAEEFQEIINKKNFDFPVLNQEKSGKNSFLEYFEGKNEPVSSKKETTFNKKLVKVGKKPVVESLIQEFQEFSEDSDDSSEIIEKQNTLNQKTGSKLTKKLQNRKNVKRLSGSVIDQAYEPENQMAWIEEYETIEPDTILTSQNVFSARNSQKKSLPAQTSFSPTRFNPEVIQEGIENPSKRAVLLSNSSKFQSPSSEVQSSTKVSLKFNSGQVSYSFKSKETRSKPSSDAKVKELLQLEKKLTKDFNKKEQEFMQSLINTQPNLFSQYKDLKSQLEKIRKELNIYVLSTGIQCCLIENVPELKKTTVGPGLLNDVANSARNPLEEIRDDDEKELLGRVFENDRVLNGMSLKDKIQIVKSVKGHKKEQCREMCPHLLRVLKIKWKCRGVLYPVRNILLKSDDMNAASLKLQI